MEWAIEMGLQSYNMGGVSTDPSSPAYGVFRWKREYGGTVEDMLVLEKKVLPLPDKLNTGMIRRFKG